MFSTDQFIHFALQNKNDIYYTDTLLELDAQAYLWYVLKRHNDIVLLVAESETGIMVHTYDTQSEFALRSGKKKLFQKAKTLQQEDKKLEHTQCSLRELEPDPELALLWLLERPEQQAYKNQKTAVVISLEAYAKLYGKAREKDRQKLRKAVRNPGGNALWVILLPNDAQTVVDAFTGENGILADLCPAVSPCDHQIREPLIEALERQLEGQLTDLRSITRQDARAMLLQNLLIQNDWSDSCQDLEDQADYLHYFYRCQDTSVTRKAAFQQLKQPQFRQEIRRDIAQLLEKYPGSCLIDALTADAPEIGVYLDTPLPLEYDSSLAKSIRALSLPEEFLMQGQDHWQWPSRLEQTKRALRTAWNCPVNPLAAKWAETFCTEARTAIQRQDWDTLSDALILLDFCGEQICCRPQQDESLLAIFEMGSNLIKLSYNRFLRERNHPAFGSTGGSSIFSKELEKMQKFKSQTSQAKSEVEQVQMQMLRTALEEAVRRFEERPVSREEMAHIWENSQLQAQAQVGQLQEQLTVQSQPAEPERSQPPAEPTFQPKSPEPEPPAEPDVREQEPPKKNKEFVWYGYGDEDLEDEEIPEPLPSKPSRQAGDLLRKKLGLD